MSKIALITGVNGQDGSYLSEHLLELGYEVHGTIRRSSVPSTDRIDNIFPPENRDRIHYADLTEGLSTLIHRIRPDCIFNTAAMSHVAISFKNPIYTAEVNAVGVLRLLEDIKAAEQHLGKRIRFLQCSSSEMFGKTPPPQHEGTYFSPQSPYGASKLFAYWVTRQYRDGHNLFACNSICFNHESPRRGVNFVTRKITRAAARIALGLQKTIELGNLDAKRDWGHSADYVRAMRMILEHDMADDWVISTGEYHSVREFAERVFARFNLDFYKHLVNNDDLRRPNEVDALLGVSDKIRTILGWKPEYSFDALVEEMCASDYRSEKRLADMSACVEQVIDQRRAAGKWTPE